MVTRQPKGLINPILGVLEEEASKEDEDEKEEEHLAPADSTVVSPDVDHDPFAEETESFETDKSAPTPPPPAYYTTTRMFIPSPRLPLSSPPTHTFPTYAEAPLGYRAARIRLRAASPVPSPTLPPIYHPLPLPLPSTSRRADIPEADLSPRKRLLITAPTPRFEVEKSSVVVAARQPDLLWPRMPPKRNASTTITTPMTDAQIKALIAQGVADDLVERDTEKRRNGDDSHDSGSDRRRRMHVTRECTYNDFLKCQSLNFKGTEGVVGLTQWFKRIEFVFYISNCAVKNQVKFATCTLYGITLTWWNTHVKIVGHDVANSMPWKTVMKIMTAKYCPRNEIKKLEIKI
nr:hypothetical protein [Tanacetum cinerariifolium]